MKITFFGSTVTLEREPHDPKFYGTRDAKGESALLHYLKCALNASGRDFIKRRMWKDGHMVDGCQQYLRSRKPPFVAIFNSSFAIEGANDAWNRDGKVTLSVENL